MFYFRFAVKHHGIRILCFYFRPVRESGMIRGAVLCEGKKCSEDFAFQFIADIRDATNFYEIFGALLAFAKNGNPDHEGLPHWPEAEAEDADTMVFDRKTEVKHNYDDKVFAEINKVLKPWSFMDMMADNIQH